MDLVPVNETQGAPSLHEMQVFQTIAKHAVESRLYNHFGGQPAIMMTMLAARELGISPMLALNGGIANIQGKLEISARMMNALMRRSGIKIEILESTDDKCVLKGTRAEGDTATVSYTIEDAKKAGLVKPSGGWVKNPKDMCFARAISRLARQIAPDVIGGCYVEGEIKALELDKQELPTENIFTLADLLELFEEEDKFLIQKYMKVVMTHFSWDEAKVIQEFMKDQTALKQKFNIWKEKYNAGK